MGIDDIRLVCVVGAGTMGRQIALNTALYGYSVTLCDVSPHALEGARAWATEYLDRRMARGRLTREQAQRTLAQFQPVADLREAAGGADLVIEAVTEDLDLKRQIFVELDRICRPRTILATNSSTIPSSRLADATSRPDRIANLHYFNPALAMEVVEVVQGAHTSEETALALVAFARRTGKLPIHLKKEIFGFVANRLLDVLLEAAIFLVEGGYASPEQIDQVAEKGLGHPMGPFRLMDLIGIDVVYLIRQQKHLESGRDEDRPPRSIVELYERGDWGQKTGRGWYAYPRTGDP